MSKQSSMVHLAISSVLALSGVALTSTALAADDGKEQCAGIAKAGKNDCATSTNACHGHVTATATPKPGSTSPRARAIASWAGASSRSKPPLRQSKHHIPLQRDSSPLDMLERNGSQGYEHQN